MSDVCDLRVHGNIQTVRKVSPISYLFGGSMRSVVKSHGVKESITIQPFQSLQLDITPLNVHSLSDALKNLTLPERLHGFTLNDGKTPTEATKQTLLEALPRVLILHLKRFVYDSDTGLISKDSKFVAYGTELEIEGSLLSSVGKRLGGVKYRLQSGMVCLFVVLVLYVLYVWTYTHVQNIVVYHHGDVPSGGHYTCHVCLSPPSSSEEEEDTKDEAKDEANIWVEMDDALLERIPVQSVLGPKRDRQAYMLFYIREMEEEEL